MVISVMRYEKIAYFKIHSEKKIECFKHLMSHKETVVSKLLLHHSLLHIPFFHCVFATCSCCRVKKHTNGFFFFCFVFTHIIS